MLQGFSEYESVYVNCMFEYECLSPCMHVCFINYFIHLFFFFNETSCDGTAKMNRIKKKNQDSSIAGYTRHFSFY